MALLAIILAVALLNALVDEVEYAGSWVGRLWWAWWYGPYRAPTLYTLVSLTALYLLFSLAREL